MFQPGWKVKCHPAVASGSMSLQINAFEGHLSRPLPHLVGTGLHGRKWVSGRQVRVASSVLTTTPHRSHYQLNSVSCQISGGICRNANPPENCPSRDPGCMLLMRIIPKPSALCPPLIPPVEKLSSMKLIPGAKRTGDCWLSDRLTMANSGGFQQQDYSWKAVGLLLPDFQWQDLGQQNCTKELSRISCSTRRWCWTFIWLRLLLEERKAPNLAMSRMCVETFRSFRCPAMSGSPWSRGGWGGQSRRGFHQPRPGETQNDELAVVRVLGFIKSQWHSPLLGLIGMKAG